MPPSTVTQASLASIGAVGAGLGAARSHTTLNFTTADVTAAAHELAAKGLEVHIWDETYGKQGVIITPHGTVIGLNEDTQVDLYGGYRVHKRTAAASLDSSNLPDRQRHAPGGLLRLHWVYRQLPQRRLTADAVTRGRQLGVLALRQGGVAPVIPPAEDQFGPPYVVQLTFKTSEPFDALAEWLRRSGYEAAISEDQAGPQVSVTDPDGEEIQVRPAA